MFLHVVDAVNVLIKRNYRVGSSDQPDEALVRHTKAYEGDEIYSFLTSALDWDLNDLNSGVEPLPPNECEAEWAPYMVGTF